MIHHAENNSLAQNFILNSIYHINSISSVHNVSICSVMKVGEGNHPTHCQCRLQITSYSIDYRIQITSYSRYDRLQECLVCLCVIDMVAM